MKKAIIFVAILGAATAFCLLLFFLLAPTLVNTETVRSRVGAWFADKTGGFLTFQRADVRFFPRVQVLVSGVSGTIPEKAAVSSASVRCYLSLLPLLSGKVDITKVLIEEPKISLALTPGKSASEKTEEKKTVDEVLAVLVSKFPGIVIAVDNGTIDISRERQTLVTFKDVHAGFSTLSGKINADLGISAGFAKRISIIMRVEGADSSRNITLQMRGTDVDISPLRHTAFALVGENPVAANLFSYLKGGQIPEVSVGMTGRSFEELGGLDDLVIKGRLRAGKVSVPHTDLLFQDVSGNCSISGGILRGENLRARLQEVQMQKGVLTVGLKGADAPFRLEGDVKMNYENVSALLDRFLKERPFPLNRVKYVRGLVTGRLVMGDSVAMFKEWKEAGHLKFDGRIVADSGPFVDLTVGIAPKTVEITKLNITDRRSKAALSVSMQERAVLISFRGLLERKTVDKLLDIPHLPEGFVEGDIRASVNKENILLSSASGSLSVERMPVRIKDRAPFDLERVKLKAEGSRIAVESAVVKISDSAISLKGMADVSSRGIVIDMDASAELIRWESVSALLKGAEKDAADKIDITGSVRLNARAFHYGNMTGGPAQVRIRLEKERTRVAIESATLNVGDDPAYFSGGIEVTPKATTLDMDVSAKSLRWDALKTFLEKGPMRPGGQPGKVEGRSPLTGSVRFAADTVFIGKKKISPAHANISLSPDVIRIDTTDMMFCNIRVPGGISITGDTMSMDFRFGVVGQPLKPTLECLTGDQSDITGKFVLKGSLGGKGKTDQIVRALHGGIDFRADGGRINKSLLLLNVYSLLNVSGYLSGNIGDLFRQGIGYRSITLKADIRGGRLIITEATLDAPSMEMVATGGVDLTTGKIDLQMLAVPLTTVDVILGKVPVLGKGLRGSLVSVAITVSGDLNKPVVKSSATAGVGSTLVNLMKKTVKAPFTIVDPEAGEKKGGPGVRKQQ